VARKRLICRHANHDHTILNSYSRDLHREDFVKWARRLTAPYIKWQSHVHSHYIIEKGDCLPMYADERKQQASEEVRGSGIGGQATGQPEGFSYGGFSEVHKVKICDSHSAFGSQRVGSSPIIPLVEAAELKILATKPPWLLCIEEAHVS
jgi:hypothetical protein